MIYLVDRAKDLIIVSGFNVFPAEVEEVHHARCPAWPSARWWACPTPTPARR
jgi:acyl-CoA synthetase (AMP-forming)/AMP-acid ligase II